MGTKLKIDRFGHVAEPTFILTTRSGKNLCLLPARHIHFSDSMSGSEVSFDVYKEECSDQWDKIKNFRLMYCPEYDSFYELTLDLNETTEIMKSISCVSLGEAELSQILLHDIEINTETDIARDDYVPTVLYDTTDTSASLLHRIMEKAPHYTIDHVDTTIADIQRTFTFDGTTLYDAFQEIGDEIGCLFVIKCSKDDNGAMYRSISVYDLMSYCLTSTCHKRSDSIDVCQHCGGTNLQAGYGDDTTIFISTDNLTDDITYTTDTGAVKNCFRLVAGDDLMTATVRSINPNGSDYIWYISDDMREDMSDDLSAALTSYDTLYNAYNRTMGYTVSSDLVNAYNNLINKYTIYDSTLQTISASMTGYSAVMDAYYNVIDFVYYLSDELMPDASISDTSAAAQAALLTAANIGTVAVTDISIASSTTADSAVLAMAKTIVDSRYQVKISESTYTYTSGDSTGTWVGKFSVTNYSDDTDTDETQSISLTVNDDYTTYVQNKIDKALANKATTSGVTDISGLFALADSESSGTAFKLELQKYCLNRLNTFYDACQACLDVMVEQGTASQESWSDNTYTQIYEPYYNKLNSIAAEIALRESEIATVQGVYDENGGVVTSGVLTELDGIREDVMEALDFQSYLGEALWEEMAAYRREDEYSNSNYISDGLSNSELIANAREFFETAQNEIYKSALMQHSISASLKNLLAMPEFSPIVDSFAVGNYLRIMADGNVYKLRLMSYDIDYESLDVLDVTFSDVVSDASYASEVRKQMQSLGNISGSYDSVKRQAGQGSQSKAQIRNWVQEGLDLTNLKIISNTENQDISWDSHGLLARAYYDDLDNYSDNQVKLTNTGLYVTKDAWKTASAGIGKFIYYDPDTGTNKEGYGVIADTIVGNIILGQNIGVYNGDSSISIKYNGITITDGSDVVFSADTQGNVSVTGAITATSLTLGSNVTVPAGSVSGLSTVATSGSYGDLSGTPTIPSSISDLYGYDTILYRGDVGITETTDASTGIKTTTTTYIDSSGNTITNTTKTNPDGNYIITDIGKGTVPSSTPDNGYSSGFMVSTDGLLKASNALIYGTIYATEGQIGGVTIGSSSIYTNYFSVNSSGYLSATGATISGTITATSGSFTGTIIANDGYIGGSSGWIITSGKIYGGDSTTGVAVMQLPSSSTTYVFAAGGTSHSSYADCPFRVTKAGILYATKITVYGDSTSSYCQMGNGLYIVNNDSSMSSSYLSIRDAAEGYSLILRTSGLTFYSSSSLSGDTGGFSWDGSMMSLKSTLVLNGKYIRFAGGNAKAVAASGSKNTSGQYTSLTLAIGVESTELDTIRADTTTYTSSTTVNTNIRGSNVRLYAHDGGVYLGSSGSTAVVSDENLKELYAIDNKYEDFYNNLTPHLYKYDVGHRLHIGFGAQSVEAALVNAGLTTEDFAGIIIQTDVDIGEDEQVTKSGQTHFDKLYSLRYEEFIALNTFMIQKLMARVNTLETQLNSLL